MLKFRVQSVAKVVKTFGVLPDVPKLLTSVATLISNLDEALGFYKSQLRRESDVNHCATVTYKLHGLLKRKSSFPSPSFSRRVEP